MPSDLVLAALVAAVPAVLTASAAVYGAVKSHQASHGVKTSNGETLAELLERHTAQDEENFERLTEGQEALWEAVGASRLDGGTNPPMSR